MINKKLLSIILTLFMLAGCSGEDCIDADDFGHSKATISARYSEDDMKLLSRGTRQVGSWVDSEYRLDGNPLVITVEQWDHDLQKGNNDKSVLSAWSPWFGSANNRNTLPKIAERFRECSWVGDQMDTPTRDAQINNYPCLMKNGVGLYALLTKVENDPNISTSRKRDPLGETMHLGGNYPGPQVQGIDANGDLVNFGGVHYDYDSDNDKRRDYADGKLYFKILDRYYNDNGGQYKLTIRSGVKTLDADPITFVTKLVKSFLFGRPQGEENNGDLFEEGGIIRNIFLGIAGNPNYQFAVATLLTIFVIYTALAFLSGHIQLTKSELVIRILKIIIVSLLIGTETSWAFFNDYLFIFFVEGLEEIIEMIKRAGSGNGPGASGLLAMMIAPQTFSKLLSLLFVDWLGWLYIIIYIIAMAWIITVFFKAAVIYLNALLIIGLIIIMGPIFICFWLFGITKNLFDNWLKQLLSYAIQPIILFVGLTFISMIIREELYQSLGFRVCKQNLIPVKETMNNMDGEARKSRRYNGDSLLYWWFPVPRGGADLTRDLKPILVPIAHEHNDHGDDTKHPENPVKEADMSLPADLSTHNNDNSTSDSHCTAYQCYGQRYYDLPFLHPIKDWPRIKHFWNGKFVQLDGLFFLIVAIYLLSKFNSLSMSVGQFIAGAAGNTSLGSAAEAVSSDLSQQAGYAKNRFTNAISGTRNKAGAGRGARGSATASTSPGGDIRSSGYSPSGTSNVASGVATDKISSGGSSAGKSAAGKSKSWKKATPSKGAKLSRGLKDSLNSSLSEKREKMGNSPKLSGATKNYRALLAENLKKDIDPSITGLRRNKIAKDTAYTLSNKDVREIPDEMARIKFGTDYNSLSDNQRKDIDGFLGDTKTQRAIKDHHQLIDSKYQKAEKKAYKKNKIKKISSIVKKAIGPSELGNVKKDLKDGIDRKHDNNIKVLDGKYTGKNKLPTNQIDSLLNRSGAGSSRGSKDRELSRQREERRQQMLMQENRMKKELQERKSREEIGRKRREKEEKELMRKRKEQDKKDD